MRIQFLEYMKTFFTGRFWLDCPNCGLMFGGHEKGEHIQRAFDGMMTCSRPTCMEQVRQLNERNQPMIQEQLSRVYSSRFTHSMQEKRPQESPEGLERRDTENTRRS